MDVLNKLKNMSVILYKDHIDSELATYFINHLSSLKTMTLQTCINETGISKASIHRFYSKAGFTSFKQMVNVLIEETEEKKEMNVEEYRQQVLELVGSLQFDKKNVDDFTNALMKAHRVYFYGNIREMQCLVETMDFLRTHGKKVVVLNMWDQSQIYAQINDLEKDDVFVVVNGNMNLQNYYETSLNHSYLISLDQFKHQPFHRFFIGRGRESESLNFKILHLPRYPEHLMFISIHLFDKFLAQALYEKSNH